MTKGELLNILTEVTKKYRKDALVSVARNKHMNELTSKDLKRLRGNPQLYQRFTDALLVDFINAVAERQGVDYGLYAKHIKHEE